MQEFAMIVEKFGVLIVNLFGWAFMLGMVYQQLKSLREAVNELKTLFPRMNEHASRLATIEQRCEDRGERMGQMESDLRTYRNRTGS